MRNPGSKTSGHRVVVRPPEPVAAGLDDLDKPIQPDKGHKGGSCNRRCCQKPGATWFNRGNLSYYCPDCGELLNRENPDEFGGRMCVPPDEQPEGKVALRIREAGQISDAHPMHTGRHDLYAEAMRLVGERHAKGDLVGMTNWLLLREERLKQENERMRTALQRIAKSTKDAYGRDDYPMDRMDTIEIAREALQADEALGDAPA